MESSEIFYEISLYNDDAIFYHAMPFAKRKVCLELLREVPCGVLHEQANLL